DQDGEQIIINHRAVVVAAHSATALLKNGPPEKDSADERNQTKDRAQEIIPAINERVLNPEIENSEVLLQLHQCDNYLSGKQELRNQSSFQSHKTRKESLKRANTSPELTFMAFWFSNSSCFLREVSTSG